MVEFSNSTKCAFGTLLSVLLVYFIYAVVITALGTGSGEKEDTSSVDHLPPCRLPTETDTDTSTTPTPAKSTVTTTIPTQSRITPYKDKNFLAPKEQDIQATLAAISEQYRACDCCQCQHKDIHVNACFIDVLNVTNPDDVAFLFFFEVTIFENTRINQNT